MPLGAPGERCANSPRSEILEGTSVSIFGNLLTIRVKKGISDEKFPLKPTIVLLVGSVPKLAFCVIGRSLRFKSVPPITKLSLNLCSTLSPVKRRVCCPNTALFSVETSIGVFDAFKASSKI